MMWCVLLSLFTGSALAGPNVVEQPASGSVRVVVVDRAAHRAQGWTQWERTARREIARWTDTDAPSETEMPDAPRHHTGGLVGARVSVVSGKRRRRVSCKTDRTGSCTLEGLEPGSYKIRVERQDYETDQRSEVEVSAGEETPLLFELEVEVQHIIVT